LGELEHLSRCDLIDLYYGDESRVCLEGYVPYGWQFPEEEVFMPSQKGGGVNCFALLNRANTCHFATSKKSVKSGFIRDQLEKFSLTLKRVTVVALDNARVHTSQEIQECRAAWQERGLFLFYLPAYSPHLNITETLWRKLKGEWLQPQDYVDAETLSYQVHQALSAVGSLLKIHFSDFKLGAN
jgi:transposase